MAADRPKQADMLAYTEAQKSAFNAQIAANSIKIADLRRQQIIANCAATNRRARSRRELWRRLSRQMVRDRPGHRDRQLGNV